MWTGLVVMVTVAGCVTSQVCDDVIACPEGFSCHPGQGQCYKDPPHTDKLHVWLGEGPDECNRSPKDCAQFGMVYDVSHVHGIGEWCDLGVKVRCLVPDPPAPGIPGPANHIEVISYNIFERAWFITLDGQRERSCRVAAILEGLAPSADVFTFQEAFMHGCWPGQVTLRDLLTLYGFRYQTATISSPWKPENGGIFTASRWPILEEDQLVFKNVVIGSADQFSAKGVIYTKIEKSYGGESRVYHVMGTHFQAGGPEEVKFAQTQEWYDFMKSKAIPEDEPVIFAGDLNSNVYGNTDRFETVRKILNATLPTLTGQYNASTNPIAPDGSQINDIQRLKGKKGTGAWIDHVLYSNEHVTPISAHNTILIPKDRNAFSVCWCLRCTNVLRFDYKWPEDEECDTVESITDLADHQPVVGIFEYE